MLLIEFSRRVLFLSIMKVKSVKSKKSVAKPNWAEDDLSDNVSNAVLPRKKKNKAKKVAASSEKTIKKVGGKSDKMKKKKAKKAATESSDDEDDGAPMDKLKEIDPEFYKVKNRNILTSKTKD